MDVFIEHFPTIISSFGLTLLLGVSAFIGAVILGTIITVFRISPITPLRGFGTAYVEIFRNVPMIILIFLLVFALPDLGILLTTETALVVGVILVGSAFAAEAIRSGVNAVQTGQIEASRAIGLSFSQTIRLVVVPQALRSMISPLANIFIGLIISTSLGQQIGVKELTGVTNDLQNSYVGGIGLFLASGLLYTLTAFTIVWLSHKLERRWQILR